MSKVKRWVFRAYARLFGYFVMPCPLCGQEFYGFQYSRCGAIPDGPTQRRGGVLVRRGKLICPRCAVDRT